MAAWWEPPQSETVDPSKLMTGQPAPSAIDQLLATPATTPAPSLVSAMDRYRQVREAAATQAAVAVTPDEPTQPDKPAFSLSNLPGAIWDAGRGLVNTLPASGYRAYYGTDRPDTQSESARAAYQQEAAFNKEMADKTAAAQAAGTSDSTSESIREAGKSLGFTGISMGGTLLGSVGGGALGSLASPGVGTAAGIGAGLAASGKLAYNMAANQFLTDAFDQMEAKTQKEQGRAMTEQEKQTAYNELLPIAQNTGLWEAGPEAIGNAITLGAGKFVFSKLGGDAVKAIAGRAGALLGKTAEKVVEKGGAPLLKAGAVAGDLVQELGMEGWTQQHQGNNDAKVAAYLAGKPVADAEKPYADGVEGWWKGTKEVAPVVLATMGLMGSAGAIGSKVYHGFADRADARRAGEAANERADLARTALGTMDETQLQTARDNAAQALADTPKMPQALRDQLTAAIGHLDTDLQARANGETLRTALADPDSLSVDRGSIKALTALAGMADPDRVRQLSDDDVQAAHQAATQLSRSEIPGYDAMRQQYADVAAAYNNELFLRRASADIGAVLDEAPDMGGRLADSVLSAANGNAVKHQTPDYARASIDSGELARKIQNGAALLRDHSDTLTEAQREALPDAIATLQAELTQRETTDDWEARNAAIRERDNPQRVAQQKAFGDNPAKAINKLKAADLPLIDAHIAGLERQVGLHERLGIAAPESVTGPLALLRVKQANILKAQAKAAAAKPATPDQPLPPGADPYGDWVRQQGEQQDYVDQQGPPIPPADTLEPTGDPIADALRERENIRRLGQGPLDAPATPIGMPQGQDTPSGLVRPGDEIRRLMGGTPSPAAAPSVPTPAQPQSLADFLNRDSNASQVAPGRMAAQGVLPSPTVDQNGIPVGPGVPTAPMPNVQIPNLPVPPTNEEAARRLMSQEAARQALTGEPAAPIVRRQLGQGPLTAPATPQGMPQGQGSPSALLRPGEDLQRLLGPSPSPAAAPGQTAAPTDQNLNDLLTRPASNAVSGAPIAAQGPIANPTPRPKMTQAEIKAMQGRGQSSVRPLSREAAYAARRDAETALDQWDGNPDRRRAMTGAMDAQGVGDEAIAQRLNAVVQTEQAAEIAALEQHRRGQEQLNQDIASGKIQPAQPKKHPSEDYANWNALTDNQVQAFAKAMGIKPKKTRTATLSAIDDARQTTLEAPYSNIVAAWDKAFPPAPSPQPNQENANGLQAEAQAQAALNQNAPTAKEGADSIDLSVDDRAARLLVAIPAEPLPDSRQERIDGPRQALQFFKRNIVGKLLTTPLGKTFTAKLGHFFRLIATKPAGKQKGFIEKASSPEEAIALVENGEIEGEDIAGYQEFRAKNMQLFPDVLESPHLVLQDRARKHVFLFVKRYQRQGVEFFDAAMVTTGPKELGVLSFAPIGKMTPSWLAKHDLIWKAGSVVVDLSQTTPLAERVEQERTANPINKIPQSAESSSATAPTEAPLLSSYTQDELNARQVAADKAAAEQAARDKAADEKAAADRARNDFTLSGSDRPADVAMAQGQADFLGAMDGPAPAGYGANNTLVTATRAEELRKKLRAKFGQLNSGIDPEIMAMGAELAMFHLEAGARQFSQFVQDISADLGLTLDQMRPYLRGWYNNARDTMEDSGLNVARMDSPDQVKAAFAAMNTPVELDLFGEPIPSNHVAVTLPVVEMPVDQLKLSDDVPQFKSGADSRNGVVEPLGGKFERTGVAPIQVWKRLNGDLEVISGRHRLDLARRSGELTIPAQVHNESAGFDANKASILDAELNIRDGQGKVKDYVDYFTKTPISKAEAELRGLLARAVGQRAYSIATHGSEELIASHRANALSDEAANSIALAAPGNARLQAVAIKAVLDGKSIIQAVNTLQAVKALASEQGDTTGDMFGLDDSAMREAEQMATIASRRQRSLSERLAAIQGAAKRPELARKEGVDVKDQAALDAKIVEIKNEREAWDRWSTDPALIAQIREELHPGQTPPVVKPAAPVKPAEPDPVAAPQPVAQQKPAVRPVAEIRQDLNDALAFSEAQQTTLIEPALQGLRFEEVPTGKGTTETKGVGLLGRTRYRKRHFKALDQDGLERIYLVQVDSSQKVTVTRGALSDLGEKVRELREVAALPPEFFQFAEAEFPDAISTFTGQHTLTDGKIGDQVSYQWINNRYSAIAKALATYQKKKGVIARSQDIVHSGNRDLADQIGALSAGYGVEPGRKATILGRHFAEWSAQQAALKGETPAPAATPTPLPAATPDEGGIVSAAEQDEKQRTLPGTQPDITHLVQAAQAKNEGNKEWLEYAKVTQRTAERIQQLIGIDVSEYAHQLDEAGVRHALKEHGNSASETARGQIPIQETDFERLTEVVNDWDDLSTGNPTASGIPSLVYRKQFADGETWFVEETRTGRKKLAARTLWKMKGTAAPRAISNTGRVAQTPEAFGGHPTTILPPTAENASATPGTIWVKTSSNGGWGIAHKNDGSLRDGEIYATVTPIKKRNGREAFKVKGYGNIEGFFPELERNYNDEQTAREAAQKIAEQVRAVPKTIPESRDHLPPVVVGNNSGLPAGTKTISSSDGMRLQMRPVKESDQYEIWKKLPNQQEFVKIDTTNSKSEADQYLKASMEEWLFRDSSKPETTDEALADNAAEPADNTDGNEVVTGDDLDSFFDDYLKGKTGYEASASQSVESRSEDRPAGDGVGQGDVQSDRTGTGRGDGRSGTADAGFGRTEQGDAGLSDNAPAVPGTEGVSGVHQEDGAAGLAGIVPATGDSGTGGATGRTRVRSATRRSPAVANNAGTADAQLTPPTVLGAAASAASNAGHGLGSIIDGLTALYGGNGTLRSGLAFDEDRYQKALPFFKQAVAHFAQAGSDAKQAIKLLIDAMLGAGVSPDIIANLKPDVLRFVREVQDGTIDLTEKPAAVEATEPTPEVVQVPRLDFTAKREAQRQAATLAIVPGDLDNIHATLPFLLPEQQEDVLKAEQRFENHNGILFTNATGTGKTYTALGSIARWVRQGKTSGIIVVPSQAKVEDWIRDGQNLGLNISALADTQTAGNGLVITTYANFAANNAISRRDWDFVVYDEAHKLMSNAAGNDTAYVERHDQLIRRPSALTALARTRLSAADSARMTAIEERFKGSSAGIMVLPHEERVEYQALERKVADLKPGLRAQPVPKVVFLSATPFAYHDNLDYAEGLLFEYGADPTDRGYNTPSARQAFMIQHFGYQMRTGKLNKPDVEVNVDLMERRFFEWLRASGAVSGRKLAIEQDYSREFVEVDNTTGHEIDRGIKIINGHDRAGQLADGKNKFPLLSGELEKTLNFLAQSRLLEGIKAKAAAQRAKQHIALGRKVVVFHDYIEGNPTHPFRFFERQIKADDSEGTRNRKEQWNQEVQAFDREFSELANLSLGDLNNVIATFQKELGEQARFFNGRETGKNRAKALTDFNTDGSSVNVLVVQRDAGKEGISLHDVSGQHQRVLMDLGMPTAPTEAIQTEGRIYRYGQASNAVIEYLKSNTTFEQHLFGSRVAARSRTAENLAMGNEARNLERAFIEAYLNSTSEAPGSQQGQGGKATDARADNGDPYDNAISFYFANRKKTVRDKSREGTDYFATPEPLGMKMVEWADLKSGESALEPSAGHGAIARFFPEDTKNSFIEPSRELMTLLEVNTRGKVTNDTFENLHISNKYDAIVMNPPFGSGGKTAIDHLAKAAGHVREGGRIVILLPEGTAADQKLEKFLNDTPEGKVLYRVADMGLPTSTFQRAGTAVKTHVLVLEKHSNPKDAPARSGTGLNLQGDTVKELFENLRHISIPPRSAVTKEAVNLGTAKPAATQGLSAEAQLTLDRVKADPAAYQHLLFVKASTGRYALTNAAAEQIWRLTNPDLFENTTKEQRGLLINLYNQGSVGIKFDARLMPIVTKGLASARGKVAVINSTGEAAVNRYRELAAPLYDALTAQPAAPVVDEEAEAEAEGETSAAAPSSSATPTTLHETTHAKKSREQGRPVPWFAVTLDQKLDRDAYQRVAALAKQHGGAWSSYRGQGAIPGFQFAHRGNAEAFQAALNQSQSAPTAALESADTLRQSRKDGQIDTPALIKGLARQVVSGEIPIGKLFTALQAFNDWSESDVAAALRDAGMAPAELKNLGYDAPAPATAETLSPTDRAALIDRIVAATRKPLPKIAPSIELKGDNGNWYSPNGFPRGVNSTGERRVVGYALVNEQTGGLIGQREATEQALVDRFTAAQDRNADEMRRDLEAKSPEQLQKSAAYWLKGQAAVTGTGNQKFAAASSIPAALRDALDALAGHALVNDLVKNGSVQIVANQRDLPKSIAVPPGQRVGGAVDPETGVVYLVAGNISAAEIDDFLTHEVGTHQERLGIDGPRTRSMRLARVLAQLVGAKGLLGEPAFNDVLAQLERMRRAGNVRVNAAFAEAERAMKALDQNTNSPELVAEEALAYLVGNRDNRNIPLVRRIIAAVRAFLFRAGFKVDLTDDALVSLAQAALHSAARRKAAAQKTITPGVLGRSEEDAESARQYADVVARYTNPDGNKKDGWLKAPNSEPTKLNERQWVQVRTENFKRWFGDWEYAAHQQAIDGLETVNADWNAGTDDPSIAHGLALSEAGTRWLNDADGNPVERKFDVAENGDEIWVSKRGLKKSISKNSGAQKMRMLPILPQLIKQAHFVLDAADSKDRTAIAGYRYYVAKTEIDGKSYYVKLAIRDLIDGKGRKRKFYNHDLSEVSEGAGNEPGYSDERINSPATPTLDHIVHNGWQKFKGDVSQVIDANGEPLVVWHGTNARAAFTVFQPDSFFSNTKEGAKNYGKRIYAGFLSMKNPKIVDYYGQEDNDKDFDIEEAKDGDHDGLIMLRADDGYVVGNQYIPFDSTQIKSAIGNTGAFSPDNPDIRYARAAGESNPTMTADEVLAMIGAGQNGAEITEDEMAFVQAYLASAVKKLGVDAPSFNAWFGASKIVNQTGQPLKMYHATAANFTVFDAAKAGGNTTHPTAAMGFFFTNNRTHAAAKYGDNVMETYLAIERPYQMTDADLRRIDGAEDAKAFRARLEAQGYDGIVLPREAGKTQYVAAFYPDQIKLTDNETYTRGEKDVRFAIAQPAPGTPPQVAPPPMTRVEIMRRAIQDKFLRFKTIQNWLKQKGINLTPDADVYGAEERSVKRFAAKAEDFRNQTLKPLVQAAGKAGYAVTGGDLIGALLENQPLPASFKPSIPEYLIAQHARERNTSIAKVNPAYPDGGSGMTNAQADAILAKYRALPGFTGFAKLAEQFRVISDETKTLLLNAGLLSADQVAAWDGAYKKYIPLLGGPEDAPAKQGTGPGQSVNAKQHRALGHGLREENVLENIFRARERALLLIEKNQVGLALRELLLQANNPELGTVSQPEKKAVLAQGWVHEVWINGRPLGAFASYNDAKAAIAADSATTGRAVKDYGVRHKASDPGVIYMTPSQLAENEATVYLNGERVRMQLNDPDAARAYNALGMDAATGLIKAASSFNRWLSKAYTGFNPEFLAVNIARDLTAGMINLTGKYGAGFAAKVATRYLPAMAETWRYARDKGNHDWVDRYRAAGGSTGAAYLSDLERLGTDLTHAFQDAQGAATVWKEGKKGAAARVASADMIQKAFGWMEKLNMTGENAMRVATFRAVIEAGGTDAEAASAAANVTVNFNRRGEMGQQLSALYLFFNPNVQGTQVLLDTLLNSPHKAQAWAAAGALTGLAFALAGLARGGDDDDEKAWRTIPSTVKDRNLILDVGDQQITIPVPYGYGVFWALGNVLSDMAHGEDNGKAGLRLASALFQHFSPVGNPLSGDEADFKNVGQLLPTAARMPMEIALNRSGLGAPIRPETPAWNPGQPDSQAKWRSSTGNLYDRLSVGMNKLTGGNAYEAGFMDVSPETWKTIVRDLTGGAGQFVADSLNAGVNLWQGEAPTLKETPILRKFVREETIQDARSYFQNQAQQVKVAVGAFNAAKRAKDAAGGGELVHENAALIRLGSVLNAANKLIQGRRMAQQQILSGDGSLSEKRAQLRILESQEAAIYAQFDQIFTGTTTERQRAVGGR